MAGAPRRSVLIRRLAWASIAGQLVWLFAITVAGAAEPRYDELRDAVSELGARDAARPWLFAVAVTIWGASFLAASAALALDGPRGARGLLGPGLIGFTGVTQVLSGFPFPTDCRGTIDAACYARELAGDVSWRHAAHNWCYLLGAGALALSVVAMAWRFRGDRRWGRADLLALGSAAVGGVGMVGLFGFASYGPHAHYGLVQRIALTAGGVWVGALAVGLVAIHAPSRDPAFRLVAWIRRAPGGHLLVRPGAGLSARDAAAPGPARRSGAPAGYADRAT